METAVATAFLTRIAPKLFRFLQEKHELRRSLEHDIQYIRKEFRMIDAAIKDHDRRTGGDDVLQSAWIDLVRDLAYEIEDCIDRFAHRVAPASTDASWLRQTVHGVKTAKARQKFAAAIRELRKISEEASSLRTRYAAAGGGVAVSTTTFSAAPETHSTLAADLVGMDVPRDEILDLVREAEGQPKQLKVISIVGFGGLGKTLVAGEVYRRVAAAAQYEPRIWVRAAEKGAVDVLKEVLQELGMQVHGGTCDVNKLITSIRECLVSKRFFVVIDDMRTEFWYTIRNAFPTDGEVSSRVIVTTAIHSIANACSSAHGHVYLMRTLDEEHSRKLFFKEASLEVPPADPELGSEALQKCGGLPLALVTTAQFLQSRGNPTRTEWAKLCSNLGQHLETNDTLARMKRVLVHSYTSLPDHVLKACLLYLGIFPRGRPVRTEKLIRRWLAEGFVEEFGVATEKFKELVNRSIIQPVDVNSDTEVKTCQTHSIMLEFILQKSICESFITLLHDDEAHPDTAGKIRWLSLHHYSGNANIKDLSLVRSLTIFGKAHKSVLEFSKYELLRVLDLEECDDQLEDKHLLEICNLVLLRYLSLGGSVTVLPKEISKLKLLETLDVSRTKIKVLPMQVIKMKSLIHLLGVFRMEDIGRNMSKLQTFLSEKSKLKTLTGFVADESQGFPQLMAHMEHLTDVKIWCESTGSNSTHLSEAIKGFIQRGTDVNGARSLSLSFKDEWSQDLLNFSLEKSCYLSSLELQGCNIGALPPFVTTLVGLTELCLSSRNQLGGDILAALRKVRSLHYLKLTASHLENFVIERGALESLRCLQITVGSVTGLEIKEGALPCLESLQLLCKDLDGFQAGNMDYLGRLKEVALLARVGKETKQEWKEATKNHPKRPKLLFVRKEEEFDQMEVDSASPPAVCGVQTQLDEGSKQSFVGTFAKLIMRDSAARLQPSRLVLGMEHEHDAVSTTQ